MTGYFMAVEAANGVRGDEAVMVTPTLMSSSSTCQVLLQELDLYTDFLNFVCCKYFVPISDLYALVFYNVMQSLSSIQYNC